MDIPPKNTTPTGHIPVELMKDIVPGISVSGCPRRTFPLDPERLNEQGQPRRIEWMVSQREVDEFVRYKQDNGQPLFRVAHDLVQHAHLEAFREQVSSLMNPLLEEKLAAIHTQLRSLEALTGKMKIVENRVASLEATRNVAEGKEIVLRRPGRPPTVKSTPVEAEASSQSVEP